MAAMERIRQEARTWRRPQSTEDITKKFVAASNKLPTGELVKDEHFTLFEAVGALEIMDPKMDSGYIPPDDSFDADFDVCSGLLPPEILWIMDEIMRLEMNFQDGYPLSQNIFTSLHVFRLLSHEKSHPPYFNFVRGYLPQTLEERLVHTVLRAYCIGVIKTCELTLRTIQANTFYEEEDFVTYLFGRETLEKLSVQDALVLLTDARVWVEEASIKEPLNAAIQHRLAIREQLLQAMSPGNTGDQIWLQLQTGFQQGMKDTHGQASPVPSAFSTKVQRQLASSTPPRPMPDLTFEAACDKWARLFTDIGVGIHLVSSSASHSPHALSRALMAFAYREPPPCTYARAVVQTLLFDNEQVAEKVSHFNLLLSDMRDLVLAGSFLADVETFLIETPTNYRHECGQIIEEFMQRAAGQYLSTYSSVLQNRCRFRRMVLQSVAQLDQLESEARACDRRLQEVQEANGKPFPPEVLTLWVRFYHLQAIQLSFQLGLELDIPLPHEMEPFYASLRDLCDQRCITLREMIALNYERDDSLNREQGQYIAECTSTQGFLASLLAQEGVAGKLAKALRDLYALLMSTNLIEPNARPRPYAHAGLQYEARMKPLLGLENSHILEIAQNMKKPPMSIHKACEVVQEDMDVLKTLLQALKNVTPEKGKYVGTEDRWKEELRDLEKVHVSIKVTVSQLLRICKKHGIDVESQDDVDLSRTIVVTIPKPRKRYHDWWVVPLVGEK